MMRTRRTGNRYLAGLVIAFALLFFAVGTLGPPRHSPYYPMIVPLPVFIALILGCRAWTDQKRSAEFSGAALVLLVLVLLFSHLLPRSAA
jgi:hypothetical protein